MYLETDFNKDCKTNLADFAALAGKWLGTIVPL